MTNDVMPSPTDRDFLSWLARVSPELHGVFFLDQSYDPADGIRLGYRLALAESVWAAHIDVPFTESSRFLLETAAAVPAFDAGCVEGFKTGYSRGYSDGADALALRIADDADAEDAEYQRSLASVPEQPTNVERTKEDMCENGDTQ